ncbi:MAG TPA: hypothetical protein VHI78_02555, partial [Bacteroidales bacterium]|nr:hypothetical protein [Bacteroidales bacterium]
MKTKLLLFLLFISAHLFSQTTWYSYQSGNWAAGGSNWRTWTLDPSGTTLINPASSQPGIADHVVILNGRIVSIPTGEAAKTVASVTIQEGAVLDITTTTGHNFGANLNGSGLLRISTSDFPDFAAGTFVQPGGGTVEYRNMGGFTLTQVVYNNLILNLNNNGDVTIFGGPGAMTVNGDFSIEKGTFQINDNPGAARTLIFNGDVTVSANGQVRMSAGNFRHTITIRGNLLNNGGIVRFLNTSAYTYTSNPATGYSDVIFDNGNADQYLVCNGLTEFYRIGIVKGTDQTYVLHIDADAGNRFFLYGRNDQQDYNWGPAGFFPPSIPNNNALGLESGTVRLGHNIALPRLATINGAVNGGRNCFTIDEDARLWLDGANITFTSPGSTSGFRFYGTLRVSGNSVLDMVNASTAMRIRETGKVIIEGGTVTTPHITNATITGTHRGGFFMTGGTLTVTGNNAPGEHACFSLPHSTSSFTMTGGTILINNPNPSGGANPGRNFSLLIGVDPKNAIVTGGSIVVTIPAATDAYINTSISLPNLTINKAAASASTCRIQNYAGYAGPPSVPVIAAQPLVVLNDLVLQNFARLNSSTTGGIISDVTVNHNFVIGNNAFYVPNTNTTFFKGNSDQLFNMSGTVTGNLYNLSKTGSNILTITNSNAINPVIVNRDLTIGSGCVFADNGRTVQVNGNIVISGTHFRPVSGAGSIQLTGAAAQTISGDGNGVFNNLILNKTGGSVTLLSNLAITGDLRLTGAGSAAVPSRLNIGEFNLKFEATGNVYSDAAPGTARNFNENRMIQTTGLVSDGGVSKVYSSAAGFVFPFGFQRGATYYYMPADISFSTPPAQYGAVTSRPVNAIHPLAQSPNSLSVYWRTTGSGFSGISGGSVVHKYYHDFTHLTDVFVNGVEATYIPGAYRGGSTWSVISDINNVNEGTNEVLYDTAYTLNGDYTAGNPAAFNNVPVLYSVADGSWNNVATWSDTRGGTNHPGIPGPNTIVYIVDNHTVNTPLSAFAGSLVIDMGSTLDLGTVQGHNFASLPEESVSGRGTLKIASTNYFPQGDFGDFIGANGGTVEYYTIAGNLTVPVTSSVTGLVLDHYYNLTLNPANGTTIILPNSNLTIYNDLTKTGTGQANTSTALQSVTVNRDLNISTGVFQVQNTNIKTIKVYRDLIVNGTFNVSNSAGMNHILELYRSLSGTGTFDVNIAPGRILTFFKGESNAVISGNAKDFYSIEVDKGTSQTPVLDVTANLTSAFDPKLVLKNGTFRLSAGTFDVTTAAGFIIPQSACLSVNGGTLNVITADNSNHLNLIGKLEVLNGVLNVGNNSNNQRNDIEYSSGGYPSIDIRGGSLYVKGQIKRSSLTLDGSLRYTQSGGNVYIQGKNQDNSRAKFEVCNDSSVFNFSNGQINIYRGGGSDFGDLYLRPDEYLVTGGTIVFAPVAGLGAQTYTADATCNLHHLIVPGNSTGNSATVSLMVNPLTLTGDLIINANGTFNCNNRNLSISGNFTNNGTFTPGNNITTFFGNSAQTANFGVSTAFNKLTVDKSVGSKVIFSGGAFHPVVNDTLLINSGTLENAGTLNIVTLGNIINNGIHSSTGTGNLVLHGTRPKVVSGNGSGRFGNISVINAFGVSVSSDVSIDGLLSFTSGTLNINDFLLSFSETAPSPTGTALNMCIISNGVLSDGGIRKYFPAGAASFNFGIGVAGKYTPVNYTISSSTAPGSITVKPVNVRIPSTFEPVPVADELQYYWNISSTGFSGLNVNSRYTYMA